MLESMAQKSEPEILECFEGIRTTDHSRNAGPNVTMSTVSLSPGSTQRNTQRRANPLQVEKNKKKKEKDSFLSTFQNPFALFDKGNTRNITSNLGHVDGRSLRKNDSFPSKTDLAASSPVDWDKLERPRRHSHEED